MKVVCPETAEGDSGMPSDRRVAKQTASFKDRLTAFANDAREKASQLPPGVERNAMLAKARQADTASRLEDRLNSTVLQPRK
jgi:hypothetical protein